MKKIALITVAAITVFALLLLAMKPVSGRISSGEREKDKCYEYEAQSIIPPGSCECSEKLFDDWSKSYDWIDACAILKEKNK